MPHLIVYCTLIDNDKNLINIIHTFTPVGCNNFFLQIKDFHMRKETTKNEVTLSKTELV